MYRGRSGDEGDRAERLAYQEAVDLAGPFQIHHVRNTGIAFGLFPGKAEPVTILTAIAVIWMLVYFARAGARHPLIPVALGLLLGGSLRTSPIACARGT